MALLWPLSGLLLLLSATAAKVEGLAMARHDDKHETMRPPLVGNNHGYIGAPSGLREAKKSAIPEPPQLSNTESVVPKASTWKALHAPDQTPELLPQKTDEWSKVAQALRDWEEWDRKREEKRGKKAATPAAEQQAQEQEQQAQQLPVATAEAAGVVDKASPGLNHAAPKGVVPVDKSNGVKVSQPEAIRTQLAEGPAPESEHASPRAALSEEQSTNTRSESAPGIAQLSSEAPKAVVQPSALFDEVNPSSQGVQERTVESSSDKVDPSSQTVEERAAVVVVDTDDVMGIYKDVNGASQKKTLVEAAAAEMRSKPVVTTTSTTPLPINPETATATPNLSPTNDGNREWNLKSSPQGNDVNSSVVVDSVDSLPVQGELTGPGENFIRKVCVAIPSARRFASDGTEMQEPYIERLVEKLYEGLSVDALADTDLFHIVIANVDRDPPQNAMPGKLARRYVGVREIPSAIRGPDEMKQLEKSLPSEQQWEEGPSADGINQIFPVSQDKQLWRIKEVLDTIDLLRSCISSGRPYTLFLEDDVLPTGEVWSKLETNLKMTKSKDPAFAFMTLYNPSNWEVDEIEMNMKNTDKYDYFCCTQGLLFENARIGPIMQSMRASHAKLPVDHILVDYIKNSQKYVYVSIPNLFQHVGAYSTLAERTMDPPEVAHDSWSWQELMSIRASAVSTIDYEEARRVREHEAHWSKSFVE